MREQLVTAASSFLQDKEGGGIELGRSSIDERFALRLPLIEPLLVLRRGDPTLDLPTEEIERDDGDEDEDVSSIG